VPGNRFDPSALFRERGAAMKVQVRYFASLVERTGRTTETIEIQADTNVERLWAMLIERHPSLAELNFKPLVACDLTYADWDAALSDVREVAFLPPVSGG
jgi:molybdopterin synthase sulfur carrier subunit